MGCEANGNVIEVLQERGFIDAMTSEDMSEMAKKPFKVYCGFDPTGDSLHIGHMVALMGLAWFQRYGHTPIAVVGGATGMIGDPSGKSAERQLLSESVIAHNIVGIRSNLETILNCSRSSAIADDTIHTHADAPLILNNFDWFKNFSLIDFLRDVGKYFRIGTMLAKDSVKQRLNAEEGLSFTEFTYQVLQGYDFLHLYDTYGVTVQIGGSDQWGNITAGTDLIRKVRGQSAFGVTFPLLTRSDGQKFGKSEKGATWLSQEKCSPYEFYQYLVRIADVDVIKMMRLLTFISMDEIRDYEKMMQHPTYIPNTAQKRLAEEVTRIVHGEMGLHKALRATEGAAPGCAAELNASTLEAVAQDMPSCVLSEDEVVGKKIVDVVVRVGLQESKGDVRKLIRNGGIS